MFGTGNVPSGGIHGFRWAVERAHRVMKIAAKRFTIALDAANKIMVTRMVQHGQIAMIGATDNAMISRRAPADR